MRKRLEPRLNGSDAIDRAYARAIDLVYFSLREMSYPDSLRALRRIEAEYVQLLPQRPKSALELRRRTAELVLEQALVHGCSKLECRRKLVAAELLGWSDISRSLHFHLLYARGMITRGHYRAARTASIASIHAIHRELARIERLPRRRGRKYFTDWLGLFDQVHNALEATKSPGFQSQWDFGGRFRRGQANCIRRTEPMADCPGRR